MNFKPLTKTQMFDILKEIHLEPRGLTNKEIAGRIFGIKNPYDRKYRRLSAMVSFLEKEGYLKRVGEKENPRARNSPIRDITERGEGFLELARKGGEIRATKIRLER